MASRDIGVRSLGLCDYGPVFEAMKVYTEQRGADGPDQLWVVEHPPVFTLGQASKDEHLLMPGNIPVVKTDRGGQVTYHGPGQVVIYVLVNLKGVSLNVRQLVCAIETSIKQLLVHYGLEGQTRDRAPGVYVDSAKIASLGLRIRKGNSYHGLAFNADMDLEPFSRINPCGYPGLEMTRLADLLPAGSMPAKGELIAVLLDRLSAELGYDGWYYLDTADKVSR
ncbi:MAG TPA: octanoyltransferase [Porticoccaceae bacterium]|nr:octanoyltransferase [Porticoccaceae bacterium]HCO61770.1 octanoyltransferase [Porticoccaceae bacterium]